MNDCNSLPCQNGGVCDSSGKGYFCLCTPDFTGSHCETGGFVSYLIILFL